MATSIVGRVGEIEQKISERSGRPWLIKLQFMSDSGSNWLSIKVDKDMPKAFVERMLEEEPLPTTERTTWQLEIETRSESGRDGKTYENTYIVAARSNPVGHEVHDQAQATEAGDGATPAYAPQIREVQIARAVAYKEIAPAFRQKEVFLDAYAEINELVNIHTQILLGLYVPPEGEDEDEDDDKGNQQGLFTEESF
jgi:hypothetical protein